MDLVDRDRAWRGSLRRGSPSSLVAPVELAGPVGDRGGLRRLLGREGDGIGLQRHQRAVGPADLELVARAGLEARHEQLPDAAILPEPHRVAPAVPVVEVADHADLAGVRRPDGEAEAVDAVELARLGAEHPVDEVGADLAQGGDVVLLDRASRSRRGRSGGAWFRPRTRPRSRRAAGPRPRPGRRRTRPGGASRTARCGRPITRAAERASGSTARTSQAPGRPGGDRAPRRGRRGGRPSARRSRPGGRSAAAAVPPAGPGTSACDAAPASGSARLAKVSSIAVIQLLRARVRPCPEW